MWQMKTVRHELVDILPQLSRWGIRAYSLTILPGSLLNPAQLSQLHWL